MKNGKGLNGSVIIIYRGVMIVLLGAGIVGLWNMSGDIRAMKVGFDFVRGQVVSNTGRIADLEKQRWGGPQ